VRGRKIEETTRIRGKAEKKACFLFVFFCLFFASVFGCWSRKLEVGSIFIVTSSQHHASLTHSLAYLKVTHSLAYSLYCSSSGQGVVGGRASQGRALESKHPSSAL
jgi:hypothetical protein